MCVWKHNCLHFLLMICLAPRWFVFDDIDINISYIILKHVIWRFQIYNLFLEIFKFREYKSNNEFREVLKCFRKTVKFEFFAKQIIYLKTPDHALQNDTGYVYVLRV